MDILFTLSVCLVCLFVIMVRTKPLIGVTQKSAHLLIVPRTVLIVGIIGLGGNRNFEVTD